MAVTINATAGDSTANSYITFEEATEYFDSLTGMDWNESTITDDLRKEALVIATRQIDQLKFLGKPYGTKLEGETDFQKLEWPRRPETTSQFTLLPITVNASGDLIIPETIREACAVQANYLLATQSLLGEVSDRTVLQREGVQSMSVPGMTESYSQMGNRSSLAYLNVDVVRMISKYIKRGGRLYRG